MPNSPSSNEPIVVRGNLIRGQFAIPSDPNGEWTLRSPADFGDEIGRFTYSYRAIDDAIQGAREAFAGGWRRTSAADRAQRLQGLRAAIVRRAPELARVISREIGKPAWEADEELASALETIDATIESGLRFVQDFETSAPGAPPPASARESCRHRPLGVIAAVASFDAPLLVPVSQVAPALLAGNAVVLKPSERAPLTGQMLAECLVEAGFRDGVVNLVQGDREVGRRLCSHEGVDGILFAGSNETGGRIRQDTLLQPWKMLSLQMGAKNSMIVWDDAGEAEEIALQAALVSAYASAGQRPTSVSRIFVRRRRIDAFVTRFHERAKAFKIGPARDNPFMGPLIDAGAVDRYMKFIGIATREGCELVMRGKSLEGGGLKGHYVTPSICLSHQITVEAARKSIYQQTEIFAPNVLIVGYDELDEAIALANSNPYGLVTSVFSGDPAVRDKCADELACGQVHWNRGTLALSPRLPLVGMKKSGNHLDGGVMTTASCLARQSLVDSPEARPQVAGVTGLNWE